MSALAWVLLCSGVWFAIGLVTGVIVHLLPVALVDRDTWLTRLRPFEARGRWYERRLGIRRWKDRLPEAGDMFRGGFSKRHIRDRSSAHLRRFAAETRRAEYVHWMNAVAGFLFLAVLPLWAGIVMVLFGLVVHLPFVCIQRYNRARLAAMLARRGDLPAPDAGAHVMPTMPR